MEWQPIKRQIVLAIGIAIALLFIGLLFWWLWGVLAGYIQPKTPTDKKDLVNVFVVIAAGVVGTLTAIAALGNLIISRRNLQNAQATLQQQRDLDERRAQDDALQAYYKQMGDLLTTHKLMETEHDDDPLRLLAQGQTLTVLDRFDRWHKRQLLLFLHSAGLIKKDNTIVVLAHANLNEASLSAADLHHANLRRADLHSANLYGANLYEADLNGADLRGANLHGANLRHADLHLARLSRANLQSARLSESNLSGAKLNGAYLSGADLSDSDLRLATLQGTHLNGAYLSGADLSGANLQGARFNGADLSGANLRRASEVTEGQLSKCKSLEGAILPNGKEYEESDQDEADSS
jgi:uncharacterized protein YjbI with pentapeptide repeats